MAWLRFGSYKGGCRMEESPREPRPRISGGTIDRPHDYRPTPGLPAIYEASARSSSSPSAPNMELINGQRSAPPFW